LLVTAMAVWNACSAEVVIEKIFGTLGLRP